MGSNYEIVVGKFCLLLLNMHLFHLCIYYIDNIWIEICLYCICSFMYENYTYAP